MKTSVGERKVGISALKHQGAPKFNLHPER
uniref:Uncharacterized protein n=1 Tax=Arundo donax TaxID=35708 RepID=A0A0A8ZR12_ARUDO